MACLKQLSQDLEGLLSSPDRDYLINNNDDEVEIESLRGKTVGFYFSAAWSGACQRFTPILIEAYNEVISSINGDFEIVFVSADEDEDSFEEKFRKMPWIAIPFFDSETRSRLDELFEVKGLPHLAILDESGKLVLNHNGIQTVREYGAEAYPFKPEKIQKLKHRDEAAKINLSLTSILVSRSRDYLVSSDGDEVPVSDLDGKTVGLYFSMFSFKACMEFTPKLVEVYEKLKANGESFEIVMIPLDTYDDEDEEEESIYQAFQLSIPWLSVPIKDNISCRKLVRFFNLSTLPTLVIIGQDGTILHSNAKEAIEEHGVLAFPFTPTRFEELQNFVREKEEAQTLESILVSGDLDFVITKDGDKIPVVALGGKNILLYFSAKWSSPCRAFQPELLKAYHNVQEKDDDLEVIFVSSDRDEASFKSFFSGMPWLALPYGDSRISLLKQTFKIQPGIPKVVAIGPDGRTVTRDATDLIMFYGAEAYPFTNERLNVMVVEMAKRLPNKVKHRLHEEHELVLGCYETYICNECYETGCLLSFCCRQCNFDLHPKCALGIMKI